MKKGLGRVRYKGFVSPQFIFLLLIFVVIGYGGYILLKSKVGDLRPSLLPSGNGIVEQFGEPVDFPLTLPPGFKISLYAKDLGKIRDLQFSPEGTLLVSNPTNGKVYALPDKNNDGIADETKIVYSSLDKPHGLVFYKDDLYVAEETKVTQLKWSEDVLVAQPIKTVLELPKGGRHTSRTIEFDKDGNMYVSVGSSCDVCFESHPFLASIIRRSANGANTGVFATGLRNAVFIKFNHDSGKLWGTEMGRDFLGDNLPPDEINIIKDNADYAWPVCYGDRVYDTKFGGKDASYCEDTVAPTYKIPAHSAPLGLNFIHSDMFPSDWQGDLLVSYHGSWNRSTPVGYKVVRLDLEGDNVLGESDFITGWLTGSSALGRPVDLEFGPDGSLYISDDKAGVVYRVYR